MLEHYLDIARPWLDHYGYLALFGSIFVEGFGLPAPGQSMLIASALLADKGHMTLAMVLTMAWLAAVLGNSLGYAIGHWGGHKLLLKLKVSGKHLARVEDYFQRHGGWIVVVARFFEVLRQLNGMVAGSMGMPWLRFTLFNALGATLWVGLWGGGVYLLGQHLTQVEYWLKRFEPWAILVGVVALLVLLWYLFKKRTVQS